MEKRLVKIAMLKGCGAFADFKWAEALGANTCLKRRNVFFGWNGSGKTALSRILRAIEDWQSFNPKTNVLPNGGTVQLRVEGQNTFSLRPDNVSNLPPVHVFNCDYIQETIGSDNPLSPIVTLSKKSKNKAVLLREQQQRRETVRTHLKSVTSKAEKLKEQLSALYKEGAAASTGSSRP